MLTDDELMRVAVNKCDALNITRVHEMRGADWHATTIFNGDAALLRVIRAVAIAALNGDRDG